MQNVTQASVVLGQVGAIAQRPLRRRLVRPVRSWSVARRAALLVPTAVGVLYSAVFVDWFRYGKFLAAPEDCPGLTIGRWFWLLYNDSVLFRALPLLCFFLGMAQSRKRHGLMAGLLVPMAGFIGIVTAFKMAYGQIPPLGEYGSLLMTVALYCTISGGIGAVLGSGLRRRRQARLQTMAVERVKSATVGAAGK